MRGSVRGAVGILCVCLVQGRSGRVVFTEECQGKIDGVAPIMKEKTDNVHSTSGRTESN